MCVSELTESNLFAIGFISNRDKQSIKFIEEFPINLMHELPQRTGHEGPGYLVVVLEYGHNFSGPEKDVFGEDRATGEPSEAYNSNFLHPVLYYYSQLPTVQMMRSRSKSETLPRPDYIHHIVEDVYTIWDRSHSHILPLRRFLEHVLALDLRTFYSRSCFLVSMTRDNGPEHCEQGYLQGQGLFGANALKKSSASFKLMLTI